MRKFALFAMVLGLVGCRDSSSGDDTPMPDGQDANDVRIYDIQSDSMPGCAPATPEGCVELKLKGVVVTAIDNFGDKKGDIFVQEPEGGPYSGVQVYGAPLDQVAQLQIGDVVDIAGAQKTEFVYTNSTNGSMSLSLTELEPVDGGMMTITKTGASMTLEPAVVDALAIGQMSDPKAPPAEWEKWEGVLVKVTNVQAFSKADCIKSAGSCPDATYEAFDATGNMVVQSSLAAMPTPKPAFGDCFSSITGVVGSFYDYYILPRTTAEFGTGGTSCPTENTAATCTDGVDNDGSGFKDCADNKCILADATCHPATTISAIQTAATPPTGGVEIQNVCVTALSRATGTPATSKNLWVQTSDGLATANNGIYVFGPGTDYGAFTPGKKVNIIGTVKEFNNSTGTGTLTEISAVSVMATSDTCTPTPILNQSADNLSMDANGEPVESVLVELKNVTITTAADPNNFYVGQMQQGTKTFKFDDDIFRVTTAASTTTCFSFTGIWSYQAYDDAWYFLPTQAGTTTTCQ